MSLLEKITKRLGGPLFRDTFAAVRYYLSKKDYYSRFLAEYYIKWYIMGNESRFKTIQKYFLEDGYFKLRDIIIPQLKIDSAKVLEKELCSLLLPYISGTEFPSFFLYSEGPYEGYGIKLNVGDIVFDVGANIGIFSALALKRGAEKVYAFEPVPYAIEYLKKTKEYNDKDDKLKIIPYAVANRNMEIFITIDEDNITTASLIRNIEKGKKIRVEAITLDSFVEENKLNKVDFIKADIEGAERYMIAGAKRVLKEFKPKLAICTYHLPDDREILTKLIFEANPSYEIKYSKYKLYAK